MPKRSSALTSRDRIVGALFVLTAITAQSLWMGRAVALLGLGLVFAYLFWITTRWNNYPATVLPMYLLAIVVQCLHITEEYLTGFQREFPSLMGYQWSGSKFLAFNVAWLTVFLLAAIGIYRRVKLAYLVVFFLALAGGIANGAGHLILAVMLWRYFPGTFTAPLCLAAGIALCMKLFSKLLRPLFARTNNTTVASDPVPASSARLP